MEKSLGQEEHTVLAGDAKGQPRRGWLQLVEGKHAPTAGILSSVVSANGILGIFLCLAGLSVSSLITS